VIADNLLEPKYGIKLHMVYVQCLGLTTVISQLPSRFRQQQQPERTKARNRSD